MKQKKRKIIFCIVALVTALLAGCGTSKNVSKTQVTLAVFGKDTDLEAYVQKYNEKQTSYEIVIKDYLCQDESYLSLEDAVHNLMIESASGKGPDLVNWGVWYSPVYVSNGMFIDLSDYIESLSEDIVLTNILRAFAVDEKLYTIVPEITISTIVLQNRQLENLAEWNIEALMEYYTHREEETILFPGETSLSVFGYLCSGSIENYIDWSQGTCDFKQKSFTEMLEFANMFPETLILSEDTSVFKLFQDGKALMYPMVLTNVLDLAAVRTLFGQEQIVCMGYPMGKANGNVAEVTKYAFSVSAWGKNQNQAVEFVLSTLQEDFQASVENLPVSRKALEDRIKAASEIEYVQNITGETEPKAKTWLRFENEEPVAIYQISKQDEEDFWNILEQIEESCVIDRTAYQIILEEVKNIFSGTKDISDVVDVIQSRVGIYLAEQVDN